MPVSNAAQLLRSQSATAKVFYAIAVISLMLVWFNQNSLSLYCQQKYHEGCEIPGLTQHPEWRFGAQLNQALEDARVAFVARLQQPNGIGLGLVADAQAGEALEAQAPVPPPALVTAPVVLHTPMAHAPVHPAVAPVVAVAAPPPHPAPAQAPLGSSLMVTLKQGDEVFFVGDSLMQGVAPHMANTLRKRYNVKSINLSQQSTGLAYPSFFNWPKTVQRTLDANPQVRLMVIFLGPNDPWDMPDGKGKPFLRFKSPDWEAAYRQRIDSLLETAQAHGVQVIWVGPPNMEKAKLSAAMAYLNGLYQSQIQRYGQHFLSANEILGYENDQFSYYQPGQGQKKLKTRVDDGIHFTVAGQKLIAERVLSRISFPTPQLTEH